MMDVCFIIFAFKFLQTEKIRNSTDPILKFNETVISIADETIPKTSTNPKPPGKPWFNDEWTFHEKSRRRDGSVTVRSIAE
jgi:hypothetical protein